ncbi:hypothetical protein [Shewanella spartinae]|uniref:hypothetical protein n=1 Tax=Shewanella spartinae TaxID=2864205 RepID=UPI001C6598C8|nr:hypothetical protein [Shewanella spartinae]QYJ93265.1 hypothetical protein K0I31_16990 [Shewanella spartinae]
MHRIKDFFFKPRLLFLAPKRGDEISLKPIQIVIRVFVALITAGWISFLPFYLFIIYMHENSFFSYDFFVEGIFGLNTFIVAAAILVIFMSLYFYGFFLFLKLGIQQQKEEGRNGYRFITWMFILVSVLIHVMFFELSLANDKPYLVLWLMGISAMFCAFFYSFVGHGFKKNLQNWLSPILFIAASIFLPFFNQDVTSEVVSMGLRSFNMGGGKSIQIVDKSQNKKAAFEVAGRLILLTPKNAYINSGDNKLVIVPISDHTEVNVW